MNIVTSYYRLVWFSRKHTMNYINFTKQFVLRLYLATLFVDSGNNCLPCFDLNVILSNGFVCRDYDQFRTMEFYH